MTNEKKKEESRKEVDEIKDLLVKFFKILETTEESDNGVIFHPTIISSVRVLQGITINEILTKLKEYCTDKNAKTCISK